MTDRPDYARLIDAETWAFIRETESWYPPETAGFSIAEQRRVYDAMCVAFQGTRPPGVAATDEVMGGVACRIYTPANPPAGTVLYLHGGGFVVGGLHSHDTICADIADGARVRVVSADYRLSPEHVHPAHYNDAMAAARAVAARWPGAFVLAGDSAGGTLAAAVAHAARGAGPRIDGLVLIYPSLGGPLDRGSAITHAHAPLLSRDDMLFYHKARFGPGGAPVQDPTAAPLQDHDFAGLPPTLVHVAECDPLADDGARYAEAIHRAGGHAHSVTDQGLVHGHLRARRSVARARRSFQDIVAGIAALVRGDLPWRGML